jgi:hypothetical protein
VLKDSLITKGKELSLINRIEDMRKLKGIAIGFDELMGFTKNLRTIQLPQIVKTAILTGNPLQYGIARMFQTILEHPQVKEKAYEWLSSTD